ncbi:hypothetical protein J6590_002087 [Homalodisca vitripennis]|nr:hypothetical protein J6590_002087 [Homalodisca vitripennis]
MARWLPPGRRRSAAEPSDGHTIDVDSHYVSGLLASPHKDGGCDSCKKVAGDKVDKSRPSRLNVHGKRDCDRDNVVGAGVAGLARRGADRALSPAHPPE